MLNVNSYMFRPTHVRDDNMKCLMIIMIIITKYAVETREYLRVQIITRFQGYQQP